MIGSSMFSYIRARKLFKISTRSDYHGYGENKKDALQVLKFPLVLRANPLVKAIERAKCSSPVYVY